MAMYSFVPSFREATFCGVPSCVFDKLRFCAGKRRLGNTGSEQGQTADLREHGNEHQVPEKLGIYLHEEISTAQENHVQ
jgi:hypothetical protein